MKEFKEYEFMGYSDFKHDFAIEELARKHVGGGKPCGYFVSIGNGVITALNLKQAKERCGYIKSKKPNKGLEASKAVLSILKNGPKKI